MVFFYVSRRASRDDSTEGSFPTEGSGVNDPSRRRSAGIWLPEGVKVGSSVSEVLAAFGASLASIDGIDASRRIPQKYRQPSP